MKTTFAATIVAISFASHANVLPITPFGSAFFDGNTGLVWSNGNTFNHATFNSAKHSVNTSTFAGVQTWRLPTQAEFLSLYQTQLSTSSNPSSTHMPTPPFTLNANFYWTTDIYFNSGTTIQYIAFDPGHAINNQHAEFFSTTEVGVWAVASVPEPRSSYLLFAGLVVVGTLFSITRPAKRAA